MSFATRKQSQGPVEKVYFSSSVILKIHKFWFYATSMNRCVGGTKCKFVIKKSVVPSMQKGIYLSKDEMKYHEELSCVFNRCQPILLHDIINVKGSILVY